MTPIKLQKIPKVNKEPSVEDVLARFCYHYSQYTFQEAKSIPYKRIEQMLKVATQEQAKVLYNLARAIAAPHSKDGKAYKDLLSELQEIINT